MIDYLCEFEVVQQVAGYLQEIATTNPPKTTANLWYLTAEQHAVELIMFNLAYGIILFGNSFRVYEHNRLVTWQERKIYYKPSKEVQQLSPILKLYRTILTACFLFTFFHKINGNKVFLSQFQVYNILQDSTHPNALSYGHTLLFILLVYQEQIERGIRF